MRFPDDVPVLTDGTVTLRAHVAEDLDGIHEQGRDPVTQQFTDVPMPYTRDDACRFLDGRARAWEDGSTLSFAVESASGVGPRRFSGTVDLHDRGHGIAGVAYTVHPDTRGHGVASRAVKLLADWALDQHGFQTLVWEARTGNIAGCKVAWKTGFTFEGLTRDTIPQRDARHDGWRATLLVSDSREPKSRWREPVTMTGERVRLRKLASGDEQRYLETNNDPESMQWLGTIPLPRDSERFHAHVARRALNWSTGDAVEWAMASVDDDRYVGTVVLFGLTGLDYRSAEVGYRTHPDSRGRGLLKASLALAIDHGFTPEAEGGLGLERISLNAGGGNLGSLATARSLGFTETGRDRRCYELHDGSIDDLVRFDLLREEHRERPLVPQA